MILDEDDKLALGRLQAISCIDQKVIMNVFRAVLQSVVKEIYAEGNVGVSSTENKKTSVTIPGVCHLDIDYYDVVVGNKGASIHVDMIATPKKALLAEITAISSGDETSDLRNIKEEIKDKFKLDVDIE